MDLDLHYRDFVVDDREFLFNYTPGSVPSFHDEDGNTYCAVPVFQHPDPDLARDPLSTNRRMLETVDLAMFGTLVVAGPTPDHINVLIPDTVGPTVDATRLVDLQHVVGLSVRHCRRRIWLCRCVRIRKFFRAAVRELVLAYSDFPGASVAPAGQPSICDLMRQDINETHQGTAQSSYVDIPVVESPSPLIISSTTPPPVVDAPVRSLTPNNRSLSFLQSGSADRPQLHVPLSREAVSSVCLGSHDLLNYVEPLPLDQMLYHDVQAVRAWPVACDELMAVAQRDVAVARQNVPEMTWYLDIHAAHLVACSGALDDTLPLMSVETFPRATVESGWLWTTRPI